MKRALKTAIVALALVVLAGAGVAFFGGGSGRTVSGPASAPTMRRDFSASVLATGAVQPQVGAEVKVGARIAGKVARLLVRVGDPVEVGQVIAQLESQDLEASRDRIAAEAHVAEARLADAEARSRLAEVEFQRYVQLRDAGVITPREYDLGVQARDVALAGVELAARQLDAARAALREAEVRLAYATLRAPIRGVVGSISTQEGETVAAGLSAPTFVTVVDLERLQVDAFVDEVDIGKVEVGLKARFTVDAYPGVEFEGEVVAIYPKAIIQDNVVNYDVVIDIATPYQGRLRPEMTASVAILLGERTGALAVPARSVRREGGRLVVYVVDEGGQSVPREVRAGWREGDWVEVVSGLSEGEQVLLDPQEVG